MARFDQREEHGELLATDALEEAAKHIVVVKEVLALGAAHVRERLLQFGEHVVELHKELRTRPWRFDASDALNDLQPLFDVQLHRKPTLPLQRSEYLADNVFVDNGVAAVTNASSNLEKFSIRDATLVKTELGDALMPVMNALVI